MEEISHNPGLRSKSSYGFDNDVSLGLSGTVNSIGYRLAEIEKHLHNTEHVYGNNTYMTEDYPVKFTVVGGDNAWGTELMIYAGDTIESGSTTKKFDLNTMYIVSASAANQISIIEFLYGSKGPAITPIVTDDSDDDFELAGHGLVVNDKTVFNSVTTTTGLTANNVYYVLAGSDANHFQVALTIGGAAVVLGGGDGTCSVSKLTQTSLTKTVTSFAAVTSDSFPYPILSPRITCDNRLFVRAKSVTGQTISIGFLLGLHIYTA